jgi:hypothetical protein
MAYKFYDEVELQTVNWNSGKSAVNIESLSGAISGYVSGAVVSGISGFSGVLNNYFSGESFYETISGLIISGVTEIFDNSTTTNEYYSGIIYNIISGISGDYASQEDIDNIKSMISVGHKLLQTKANLAAIITAYDPTDVANWGDVNLNYLIHSLDDQKDYELQAGTTSWEVFNDTSYYASDAEVAEAISGHNWSADAHSELFGPLQTASGLVYDLSTYLSGDDFKSDITTIISVNNPGVRLISGNVTAVGGFTIVNFVSGFSNEYYSLDLYDGLDTVYPIIEAKTAEGFSGNFNDTGFNNSIKYIAIGN